MKFNLKDPWFFKTGAVVLAVFSTSCANKIEELRTVEKEGLPFARSLAREYEKLAKNEYNTQIDADHFAVKGLEAATGLNVLPEDPNHWSLPEGALPMIRKSRERLIFALDKSGRRIAPDLAAETQVSYDCWIQEIYEGGKSAEMAHCGKMFMDNLISLEKAVQKEAPTFMVFFNLNSTTLTKDGQEEVREAARVAKHLTNHTIHISGHTDAEGARKHNLLLSQARAEAVKQRMVEEGVPEARIIAVGEGERQSWPETQPKNRLVVIHIH